MWYTWFFGYSMEFYWVSGHWFPTFFMCFPQCFGQVFWFGFSPMCPFFVRFQNWFSLPRVTYTSIFHIVCCVLSLVILCLFFSVLWSFALLSLVCLALVGCFGLGGGFLVEVLVCGRYVLFARDLWLIALLLFFSEPPNTHDAFLMSFGCGRRCCTSCLF